MSFDQTGRTLQIAGMIDESVVDGPGFRSVIFAQGCVFACEGCQNPKSQSMDGGKVMEIDELALKVCGAKLIRGVTFSGGEPFLQPEGFAALGLRVRACGKDIVTFTGYTWEELCDLSVENPAVKELIELSWLIVDGRFILSERDPSLPFRGSRNQRIIDVSKTREKGSVVEWTPSV